MALSKRYFTVQGEIVGEKAAGGSRVDYLTDALGSVTATVDSNAQVVNTYRYKPYGAQLEKTGAGTDPRFLWVGSWGYRQTVRQFSDTYIRARTYSQRPARWTSRDPARSHVNPYQYANGSPCQFRDSSGLKVDFLCQDGDKEKLKDCCSLLPPNSKTGSPNARDRIKKCMAGKSLDWDPLFGNTDDIDWFLDQMLKYCGDTTFRVCVRCFNAVDEYLGWPKNCWNPCKDRRRYYGYTFADARNVPKGLLERCDLDVNLDPIPCPEAIQDNNGAPCDCGIVLCSRGVWGADTGPCAVFWHELMHCTGIVHKGEREVDPRIRIARRLDFIYKLTCCLCIETKGKENCGEECKRLGLP
jgi:RHS repeat-associated protein